MTYFRNMYVTLQIREKHGNDAKLEETGTSFFLRHRLCTNIHQEKLCVGQRCS